MHAINETEAYMGQLIHEIGLNLKTVAHCVSIRCIRHGHFQLDQSLLRKDWNLQCILNSMTHTNQLLKQHPEMIRQNSSELVDLQDHQQS